MKKLLLLLSILLCSCSFRSDYYTLHIDDYQFTVGYDNVEYLKTTFNLDVPDTLDSEQTVNDVRVYSFDNYFCEVDLMNNTDKTTDIDKALISRINIYCKDLGERTYAINDVELDSSVSKSCEKLDGTLINKNGVACVIECSDSGYLNVVELHGDILASDQDQLDHIEIYIK